MSKEHQVRWVPLKRYCELTGETANTVHVRRSKGIWIDGRHSKKIEGSGIWVNLKEVERWIETSPCQ